MGTHSHLQYYAHTTNTSPSSSQASPAQSVTLPSSALVPSLWRKFLALARHMSKLTTHRYSFVAMLLTCCLAGIGLFAFIGAIMDIFFAGGMIAIAVLNRSARFGCPEGTGTTCRMFVATFAVAIIAVLAYLVNSLAKRHEFSLTFPFD